MPSATRRTSSNSGRSRSSTKKRGTSPRKSSSSAPVTASFDQVFGKGLTPEELRWTRMHQETQERLQQLEQQPVPTLALLRTKHLQKLWRLRTHLKQIQEIIDCIKD